MPNTYLPQNDEFFIRGGGFDRRKKRKSNIEIFNDRKANDNSESAGSETNSNGDILNDSSASAQTPKISCVRSSTAQGRRGPNKVG